MLQRILVPTDGSPLSEYALPLTEIFARAQAAEVILARVVEPPTWFAFEPDGVTTAEIYQEIVDAVDHEAQTHLEGLVKQLQGAGLHARGELLRGSPSLVLLDYEQHLAPDLVIMGTHGRSGVLRFALGSVADRLVREGTAPVLLIRSQSPARTVGETALVPLDGSDLAAQALSLVKVLAGQPIRRVRLLRAIATADKRAGASRYLEGIAQELAARGLEVETSVQVAKPGDAIAAEAPRADLVIISTHGRSGFDRLRHGSVADYVVHQSTIPTLLVRAYPTDVAPPLRAQTLVAAPV
jgi:nucleotide-binding universal stress UspA family protein